MQISFFLNFIYIYIYIYREREREKDTMNGSIQVDLLSMQKISTKLGVDLYIKTKIQTFASEGSTSRTVFLTINIHHNYNSSRLP